MALLLKVPLLLMETRDYIEKELEKLNKVLAIIFDLKQQKKHAEIIPFINDFTSKNYDFNSDLLIGDEQYDIVQDLYDQKKLTIGQIEIIAELLFEKAQVFEFEETFEMANKFYIPSLKLMEFLKTKSNVFSIERNLKINTIKNKLQIN